MAYDQKLAERILKHLLKKSGLVDKKMFGGMAFLLNGNMSVGVYGDEMIVRLEPEQTGKALAMPHVRIFDITGKPMKGWVLVGPKAVATDAALKKWIDIGVKFAESLPPKK